MYTRASPVKGTLRPFGELWEKFCQGREGEKGEGGREREEMPVARPEPQEPRVIAHVDMDCFYVQVEQRKNPELSGLPTAVVQYNSWKGGGLIAVSYEARKFGVKRSMRGDEAKKICPNIQLVQVPVARGKADLNLYRSAGSEVCPNNVVAVLASKGKCERASIDEVYLDLTDASKEMLLEAPPELSESIMEEALMSNILGLSCDVRDREKNVSSWLCRSDADYQDRLLACGAIIVAQLRVKVLEETKFTCSAGIAHNKMLAKLASGLHKPAQQTVVPSSSVQDFLASLPVKKMKQLGGKLGRSLQTDLGVNTIGDLLGFTEAKLQEHYGINTGTWLWKIARGINGVEVEDRLLPKSHGCGKTFPGPKALRSTACVKNWLDQLCEELSERIQADLNQNKRVAHTLTLHVRAFKDNGCDFMRKFPSKSCPLRYGTSKIQEDAIKLFESGLHEFLGSQNIGWSVTALSVAASKIFDIPSGTSSILRYLRGKSSPNSSDISDSLMRQDDDLSRDDAQQEEQYAPSCEEKENSNNSNLADQDKACQGKKDCNNNNNLLDQDIACQERGVSNKKSKDKGTCSILRFLSSSRTLHEKRKFDTSVQDHPGAQNSSETNRTGQQDGSTGGNNATHPYGAWTFNIEDIDQSVVDELPQEIQREIRSWVLSSKRANTNSRGSTISHYFPPARP